MKRLNTKDYIYLTISIISFILLVLLITDSTFLYASSTNIEYINFADFFRNLFYDTKELFPDFALSLNNGINLYNLIDYGFLNPIVLISYLLPFISMSHYIILSNIILVTLSTILLYKFIYNHNYSSEISFICSFLFILSTSITYNSHSNLILINYLPFLILSLIGVDKIFKDNKSYILIISLFLGLMTNLKYSSYGIIVILVYALYKYLNKMYKPTLKTFIKMMISIIGPILVSVLCAGILIVPSLYIYFDRAQINEIIVNLKSLLLPSINTQNILYSSLGAGLTSIALLSLINIFKKNKSNIFLGTILSMLIIFNIFKFTITNISIIFLPLYILVIAEFIKDIFNKEINTKRIFIPMIIITILVFTHNYRVNRYTLDILILFISILLYYLSSSKTMFIISILLFSFINSYTINMNNDLPLLKTYIEEKKITNDFIDTINFYDQSLYRIGKNETNLLNSILTNQKYIISHNKPLIGYKEILYEEGIYVYKNDNTLPIGFATSNIMSYEDFELLEKQTQQEALLNVIVADNISSNNFIPTIEKIDLNLNEVFKNQNIKINKNGYINIETKTSLNLSYELPKKYNDKIIFITFKVNNSQDTTSIKINNQINYLNVANEYINTQDLNYMLASQNQSKINISFEPGTYNISNFETYILDPVSIDHSIKNFDKLHINPIRKKTELFNGKINVVKDGYFMLSIPYAKGFDIKVNNQEVTYKRVNNDYIGFPISSGTNTISVSFTAPGKKIGKTTSIIGFITFVVVVYLESRRKF